MTQQQPDTRRAFPPLPAGRAVALAACALLGACHSHPQAKGDDQRTAEGQILPHSISDAMLPYDTASSEPPLAPHAGPAAPTDAASDAASEAESSAPEPAATPAPPG